ncbi:CHAT domain-containing protein [Nostoc commune]|uniref:CHAT domain-containing protein n=1 Tax=Nostoc commune TaxID=1178 RepID=UPI0018C50E26|nr:CHAT domain-containing protein [Nostoc commune]MBG1260613.1 CHAT domain-containing protein [Nostoc commune BAE]
MTKKVVIKLGKGNLTSGFSSVEVEIKDEADSSANSTLTSSLPSAPKVNSCYQKWKNLHKDFYDSLKNLDKMQNHAILSMICQLPFATEVIDYYEKSNRWLYRYSDELTNDSFGKRRIEVCNKDVKKLVQKLKLKKKRNINSQLEKLKIAMNDWLDTKDFRKTEKELRTALGKGDEIMVIISTKDDLAWRLPWHFWSFFNAYIKAGVVLSHPEFTNVNSNNNDFYHPKVLAIVDNKQNKNDLETWAKIKKIEKNIDLNTLSGDEFSDEEVKQKIAEKLDEKPWNILFFAGHSSSEGILIKPGVPVTIYELENPLSKAIERGLQLAIFNSCDGLDIVARDLLKINLPEVVVMREVVPNKVAEEFLKYFLQEFMANKSTPAFLALQRASLSLRLLEHQFPGASLLPVICSNPPTESLVIPYDPEPLVIPPDPE